MIMDERLGITPTHADLDVTGLFCPVSVAVTSRSARERQDRRNNVKIDGWVIVLVLSRWGPVQRRHDHGRRRSNVDMIMYRDRVRNLFATDHQRPATPRW